MDVFLIWQTHNRQWSEREILFFSGFMLIAAVIIFLCVKEGRLKRSQAAAVIAFLFFLGIVFGSTVFTRLETERQYVLIPFWSWYKIIKEHDGVLFQENILNCILLMPVGILLPIIADHAVRLRNAFLMGVSLSSVIEICQLIFKRGLFEWDDIIHNGLGCMLGCMAMNCIFSFIQNILQRKSGNDDY
ncbi:MAG: VanZ family protein [Eubacteriales bacterium]|nr:VanZ family protein [Eubacteriales bacterium]